MPTSVRAAIVTTIGLVLAALIQFVVGPCVAKAPKEPTATETSRTDETARHEPRIDEGHVETIGDWEAKHVSAVDSAGKHAVFDVIVLHREYRWACKSTDVTSLAGAPKDIERDFHSEGMQARFHDLKAVVAVGVASHEGSDADEEKRATERADQLVVWLRNSIANPVPLWSVNLGRRHSGIDPGSCLDTGEERPVIALGVVSSEQDFDLESGVRNAFDAGKVGLKRSDYHLFRFSAHS